MNITPDHLKQIRTAFALTIAQAGVLVGKHARTWYRYEQGLQPVDPTVALYLLVLLRHADVRGVELARVKGTDA